MTHATAYPYILIHSGGREQQAMAKEHRPAAYDAFMSEQTGRWNAVTAISFADVRERGDRIEDGILMPPRARVASSKLVA